MIRRYLTVLIVAVVAGLALMTGRAAERIRVEIESTVDGTQQPCYVILPDGFDPQGESQPLLVSLHSWSRDLEHRQTSLEEQANRLGWIYLFPHFRGANDHPDACGSLRAQQDILDAVQWAQKTYPVDGRRIYLTGVSGGGHMTLLMVGRHPRIWAAASAWVGISDLAAWHEFHDRTRSNYAVMMEKCCGGKPGESEAIDAEYRARSPITYIHRAVDVPVDIAAGVHDGHIGSVPVSQALLAFNAIAGAADATPISQDEIEQISRKNGRLDRPLASDKERDPALGREILLRRYAGKSRVTIFEGEHEGISEAAIDWLGRHEKSP